MGNKSKQILSLFIAYKKPQWPLSWLWSRAADLKSLPQTSNVLSNNNHKAKQDMKVIEELIHDVWMLWHMYSSGSFRKRRNDPFITM